MSDLKFSKMMSSDSFYKELDKLVKSHNLTYMDAIVFYCERNDVEIETAAAMIKGNFRIKSQIQQEGELLHFLPKTAKLPV
ncbi:Phage late-transcription coactivator [uncultured Caudovirales phage]|jgi:acid phosphatase class B|uniref:Phage late-transcription coactivator n=1 Tax=uncultured Caudovirales phage TaxID=2100421 RepID=A0A6J5M974_9CAUD|nr:Phage late-transcription coactivator [uncultured Caudovirales phage]